MRVSFVSLLCLKQILNQGNAESFASLFISSILPKAYERESLLKADSKLSDLASTLATS